MAISGGYAKKTARDGPQFHNEEQLTGYSDINYVYKHAVGILLQGAF